MSKNTNFHHIVFFFFFGGGLYYIIFPIKCREYVLDPFLTCTRIRFTGQSNPMRWSPLKRFHFGKSTFSSPTSPRLNIRQNRNWQFAIFNEPGSVLSAIGIPKLHTLGSSAAIYYAKTFDMSVKSFGIRRDKRFSEIKRRQKFSRIQFRQARLRELKPFHSFRYTNALFNYYK